MKKYENIKGTEALLISLIENGVDTIFGYPGGTIMPFYDDLYDHSDKINHILVRHEQGAVHAAEGYARSTGKVGVCVATSGPGATNLVTGIATAYMDSVPVVAITDTAMLSASTKAAAILPNLLVLFTAILLILYILQIFPAIRHPERSAP